MDGSRHEENPVLRVNRTTLFDIGYIAHNMRPDEIEQFMATAPMESYDPDQAARIFLGITGIGFTLADREGLPVLVGGMMPLHYGVYQCWLAGTTTGWEKYGMAITRTVRRLVDTILAKDHIHRLEVPVLASRTGAQKWYEKALGMTCEGARPQFGKHREDFLMYARCKPLPTGKDGQPYHGES